MFIEHESSPLHYRVELSVYFTHDWYILFSPHVFSHSSYSQHNRGGELKRGGKEMIEGVEGNYFL